MSFKINKNKKLLDPFKFIEINGKFLIKYIFYLTRFCFQRL